MMKPRFAIRSKGPMSIPSSLLSSTAWLVLAAALAVPSAASARNADTPGRTHQRAPASKAPPHNSKVLGGIQRGADATGHGIARASQATEHGVNSVSERASQPVRSLGEKIGRKLAPGSRGHAAPPAVGPQSSAP